MPRRKQTVGGLKPAEEAWLSGDEAAWRAAIPPWIDWHPAYLLPEHGERALAVYRLTHNGADPFWLDLWEDYIEAPDAKRKFWALGRPGYDALA